MVTSALIASRAGGGPQLQVGRSPPRGAAGPPAAPPEAPAALDDAPVFDPQPPDSAAPGQGIARATASAAAGSPSPRRAAESTASSSVGEGSGTPTSTEVDADVGAMKRYDRHTSGEMRQTAAWRMAVALAAIGFVTAGVGAFAVHWRTKGCLLFKLTVVEGSELDCCPPGDEGGADHRNHQGPSIRAYEMLLMMGAERAVFPVGRELRGDGLTLSPVIMGMPTPAPWPAWRLSGAHRCTSLLRWESGDPQAAHMIAIFFVMVSLVCRALACYSFVRRKAHGKGSFPLFVGGCACSLLLALTGYWMVWAPDAGSEAGPGLALVGGQILLDGIAYLFTKGSSIADRKGRRVAAIGHLTEAWKLLPRWLKAIYGYYLLGWVVVFSIWFAPLRRSPGCDAVLSSNGAAGSAVRTPPPTPVDECPCITWHLVRLRTSCGSHLYLASWGDTPMAASSILLVMTVAFTLLYAWGTWAVFRRNNVVPGIALGCAAAFFVGATLYGTIWSRSYGGGNTFSGWFVFSMCHQGAVVPLMLHLYCKYNKLLCSRHVVDRRRAARDEAEGKQGAQHPIAAGHTKSRGFGTGEGQLLHMFGQRFRKEPVPGMGSPRAAPRQHSGSGSALGPDWTKPVVPPAAVPIAAPEAHAPEAAAPPPAAGASGAGSPVATPQLPSAEAPAGSPRNPIERCWPQQQQQQQQQPQQRTPAVVVEELDWQQAAAHP